MRACLKCKETKGIEEFEVVRSKGGKYYDDKWCAECREKKPNPGEYVTGAAFVKGAEDNVKKFSSSGDGYTGGQSTWGGELRSFEE